MLSWRCRISTTRDAISLGGEALLRLQSGGGERIALHRDEKTLPKKHQLLLGFTDGGFLTVTVQGWGSAMLFHQSEVADHPWVGKPGISPLSDAFTFEFFDGRFSELKENDASSVKFFMVSKPGVWGVGNGCLQDILFRARIHPRRRALDLGADQRRALYAAIRETLRQMVALGGRDSELDLYGQPGAYRRVLSSETIGKPCPECGAPIEKIQYLGGASYFCPVAPVVGAGPVPARCAGCRGRPCACPVRPNRQGDAKWNPRSCLVLRLPSSACCIAARMNMARSPWCGSRNCCPGPTKSCTR